MGSAYEHAVALDTEFHMPLYGRKPVMFVSGDGMRLVDDDGNEYLDFVSGIGVVNVGHSHPQVVDAMCEQAGKLTHVTNLFYVEHRSELAEDLCVLAGDGFKAFFCNSGTEASEGAIKLARKWATTHKEEGARTIVTALKSFHGRTLAALAATGQPGKQEAFQPLPAGFTHVELNDIAALDAAIDDTVCAVMLEPVQGEGGVYPCTTEYLEAARSLCDERGALLIFDEVQCGLYRTGPAFAHQASGVVPDVITVAKALANGLPAGAVLAHGAAAEAFGPGDHGSTFAGGPVVCAAARATLAALAGERLGDNALRVGAYLRSGLEQLAKRLETSAEASARVVEIRGVGLMMAVEFDSAIAADVAARMLGAGIVLNNVGTHTIRFLPPLVCSESDIDMLLHGLERSLGTSGGDVQ